MESKLRAWLESKGKTKSAQRIGGIGSPFSSKTPCSTASKVRKPLFNSSAKVKQTADQSDCKREKERSGNHLLLYQLLVPSTNSFNNTSLMIFRTVAVAFGYLAENKDIANSITTKEKVKFNSPRKALSPIHNTNGIQKGVLELSFTDQLPARTPKTPFPANEEFKSFGTPLDKFDAQVSTLKVLKNPF